MNSSNSNNSTAPVPQQPVLSQFARVARGMARLAIPPLLFLLAGVALLVGLGLAQHWGFLVSDGVAEGGAAADSQPGARYICPMMCVPPQPEPGRCPVCGMELAPATGGALQPSLHLQIDPAARRVAGIRTVQASRVPAVRTLHAVGEIAFDESRQKTLAAYVDGRIEKLFVAVTGAEVEQGQRLALIYSPELYSGQVEYLLARKRVDSDSPRLREANASLLASARERLLELGVSQQQIESLEESGEANSRLQLHAPIQGAVMEKLVAEGDYVRRGQAIYRLAELSHVWLKLELFPEQAAALRYGGSVAAQVASLPGRIFQGRIAYVDPRVHPRTRTVDVRVELPNPEGLLRVGDFATAELAASAVAGADAHPFFDPELAGKWISPRHPQIIRDEPGECPLSGESLRPASDYGYAESPQEQASVVVLPATAVLRSAEASLVYVETQPGRFELRPVTLGPDIQDAVVIVAGVQAGEIVADQGNFLIDSQMQLAGNPSLIDPRKLEQPAGGSLDASQLAELEKLPREDRALAVQQGICPVTMAPLGSMGAPKKVAVAEESVFICCEGCRRALLDAPDKYLAILKGEQNSASPTDASPGAPHSEDRPQ